jgi:hypothetical protein
LFVVLTTRENFGEIEILPVKIEKDLPLITREHEGKKNSRYCYNPQYHESE